MRHARKLGAIYRVTLGLASLGLAFGCSKDNEIRPENAGGGGALNGADSGAKDAAPDVPLSQLSCPAGLPGAPLIRIETPSSVYCMDEREVTWGEYKSFLAVKGSDVSGQPAECAWNDDYAPAYKDPDDDSEQLYKCAAGTQHKSDGVAVNCVDFCDAFAFCSWAGKRLCGRVAGVPTGKPVDIGVTPQDQDALAKKEALTQLARTTAMEFEYSCTNAGATEYPYGASFEAGKCVDAQWSASNSLEIKDTSNRTCHGVGDPFDKVYDLSGSVSEWNNLCWLSPGLGCLIAGGSWADEGPKHACGASAQMGLYAENKMPSLGFRCCADGVSGGT